MTNEPYLSFLLAASDAVHAEWNYQLKLKVLNWELLVFCSPVIDAALHRCKINSRSSTS